MGRLEGKVALITGTAGGQGRAAARRFAGEGGLVVGCDLDAAGAAETLAEVRSAGGQMISRAPLDIADEAAAVAWVAEAVATYGGIDIVYNNAASASSAPFARTTDEHWTTTFRNELQIVVGVTRAAWPHLIARGGGSIINTASVIAHRPTNAPLITHGTFKASIVGLTAHLAVEGGPHGIRVNTISPGLIATGAVAHYLNDPNHPIQQQVRASPLGRVGRAEDVAGVALFLASDDAAYVTGANIIVDGGQTLGIAMTFQPSASF